MVTVEERLSRMGRQNRRLKWAAAGLCVLAFGVGSAGTYLATHHRPGAPLPPEKRLIGQWHGKGTIRYLERSPASQSAARPDEFANPSEEEIEVQAVFWSDKTLSWSEYHRTVLPGPVKLMVCPSRVLPSRGTRDYWHLARSDDDTLTLRIPSLTPHEVAVRLHESDRLELDTRYPPQDVGEVTLPTSEVHLSLVRDPEPGASEAAPKPRCSSCCFLR
jgi:hypothetical protein